MKTCPSLPAHVFFSCAKRAVNTTPTVGCTTIEPVRVVRVHATNGQETDKSFFTSRSEEVLARQLPA